MIRKVNRPVFVLSYPAVQSGTYKINVKTFKKKGIKMWLYVMIQRIKYDYVDIVEE